MINPARILADTWIGRLMRAPLAWLPPDWTVASCRVRLEAAAGVSAPACTGTGVGTYEPEIAAAFAAHATPASVVWDVGAHVGYYTIIAAARGARVHAFEPWPPNSTHLERHVALNGFSDRVTIHRVAAAGASGDGSLTPCACSSAGRLSPRGVPVQDRRARFAAARHPSLIKIDVEGGEVDALRGMEQTLRSAHPGTLRCDAFAELAAACERLLAACGYRIDHLQTEMLLATPADGKHA